MPAAQRHPDELTAICKQAEALAAQRKERPTTLHLLLTLAAHDGVTAALLDDHRVSRQTLEIVAANAGIDEDNDAARRATQSARDLAARTKADGAGPSHALLALLGERRCAAYVLLERAGVDVARLRMATMQIAVGATTPRRLSVSKPPSPSSPHGAAAQAAQPSPSLSPPARSGRGRASQAIAVSVVPTPKPRGARAAQPPADPKASSAPARPDAPAAGPDAHDARSDAPPPATMAQVVPLVPPPAQPPPSAAKEPAQAVPLVPPRAKNARVAPAASAPSKAADPAARFALDPGARFALDPGARFALDPQRFPVLAAIGRNLTAEAAASKPNVIGRDEEIDRCLDILAKRSASCPLLVGPAGVGKSACLLGLAAATATSEPGSTDDRVLVEVSAAQLLAGNAGRGGAGAKLASAVREAQAAGGKVVLVVDDIHQLLSGEMADDAGAELRAAIARGDAPCVGATTPEEHRRSVEADPALGRRFSAVVLEEPSREDAFLILKEATAKLSEHHRVRFSDDALAAAIGWSVRYMPGRALPEKALSALDLAGARARRRGSSEVGLPLLAAVISEATDVPAERMLETDAERMLALESLFAETVVGHGAQLARIATLLRRNAAGIRGRRPIGTFLLLGPTGVGKTEAAKAIAKALFHSPDAMTRLDLSEYAEPHAIARLLGAPPGYVGHEAGGQLTEAVRRRPYQVVLLDEIEKAHRDVLEAFLGVFDEGRLTDGRGRTVDFTNTVIVLTSNLGADVAIVQAPRSIGFRQRIPPEVRVDEAAVVAAARAALPPELYNRIDEVQVFAPLGRDHVREIARRQLASLAASLAASRGIRLVVDEAVYDALLAAGGFDPELGARPMRRAIGKHVEGPLAESILRGALGEGSAVRVSADEHGEIRVTPLNSPPG